MAIYSNNKAIHPYIGGRRMGTIYRAGSKIYQDYIKVGTKLGTIGNFVFENGTTAWYKYNSKNEFNLGIDVSKLKTGVRVTASGASGQDSTGDISRYWGTNEYSIYIPKSTIGKGGVGFKPIAIQVDTSTSTSFEFRIALNADGSIYCSTTYFEYAGNLRFYLSLDDVYAY